ncbi:MAG: flavodoxin-dependent (E)-4-hydroxy-3-methylbut-2-enyl-diphosphate synthase [Clostridia bacterium]|nr:flavodoxin-dependent (E)-4-hydroxy-3-methylbut-2-enyl-diphosphate synthase [Clostridia bacterium]
MASLKKIRVGNIFIGGGERIAVQSMLNTKTADVKASVMQICRLKELGCDIVRAAVPDLEAAEAIREIKRLVDVPFVADIHFDYRLALAAIEAGADKIRINPGNMPKDKVALIAAKCKEREIPIRVGVNGGSLSRELHKKYGGVTAEAMVESAFENIKILNDCDFDDICISLKASSVPINVAAYRLMAKRSPYPLHLGVTEAGTERQGIIKSAVGIGSLLLDGIGDTLRVSLTAEPEKEVPAAYGILSAAGIHKGIEIVSCPTCGRTRIDLISIAKEVEERLTGIDKPLKVAVMGCAVNGPGEARDADIGIAGGDGDALLFKKGEIVRKVKEDEIISALLSEIEKM